MNWEVFVSAVAIALVAKFASTRRMSPGQRQATIIVALMQGGILAWATPRPFTLWVLGIVGLIYAADFVGYQLGTGIDRLRVYWKERSHYGTAVEANRHSSSGNGAGSGLMSGPDQTEDNNVHEEIQR